MSPLAVGITIYAMITAVMFLQITAPLKSHGQRANIAHLLVAVAWPMLVAFAAHAYYQTLKGKK